MTPQQLPLELGKRTKQKDCRPFSLQTVDTPCSGFRSHQNVAWRGAVKQAATLTHYSDKRCLQEKG